MNTWISPSVSRGTISSTLNLLRLPLFPIRKPSGLLSFTGYPLYNLLYNPIMQISPFKAEFPTLLESLVIMNEHILILGKFIVHIEDASHPFCKMPSHFSNETTHDISPIKSHILYIIIIVYTFI